ncbi:hypothetical protein HMN09_00943800 [Mycena chlorophos]|uniref:Uncharacterized protein n=1 Tax=Mycena chlorophos TaxID=658473 RepID=A0A8H6W3Q1_MYCCL|nr:hypothetical protein HMN09_00943800 [Mycena chlorophos]
MSCATKSTATLRSALKKTKRQSSSLIAPLPFVPDMLATIQQPTRTRRWSGLEPICRRRGSTVSFEEPENYEAPPLFTSPNYEQVEPCPRQAEEVSPLTIPFPAPRRANSMPARMNPYAEGIPRPSVDSGSSSDTETSSILYQRRRSSVTTVSSSENHATVKAMLGALPHMLRAVASAIHFVPAHTDHPPTRSIQGRPGTPVSPHRQSESAKRCGQQRSSRTGRTVKATISKVFRKEHDYGAAPVTASRAEKASTSRAVGHPPVARPTPKQHSWRFLSTISWKKERERERLCEGGVINAMQ